MIGVKAKENQPGDLLRVYGSSIYERSGDAWTAVAGAQRDVSRAPADPGSAAPATDSQRYLERLASQVNIGPPGIDARSDKIISEELDHALRAINRRRARAQELMTVASGPAGGEYTRVVDAVIGTLAKSRRKIRVIGVETEGSIENALLLGRGQADYGLVQSDVAWLAVSGAGPFAADGPLTKLAALGSLYPEPVHIVVPAKSAIRSIEDLRGKRVDIGTPQSGSRINAFAVLQAHRIAIKDLAEARGDGPQAAMQQMRVGQLDAFFTTIGAPARELRGWRRGSRSASCRSRRPPRRASPPSSPGWCGSRCRRTPTPARASRSRPSRAAALLVGTVDTPQDEVKAVLELAFESTDYLAFGSAQGVKISKASGLRGIAIPLHPAAAEYFGAKPGAKPAQSPSPRPRSSRE